MLLSAVPIQRYGMDARLSGMATNAFTLSGLEEVDGCCMRSRGGAGRFDCSVSVFCANLELRQSPLPVAAMPEKYIG